MKYIKNRKVNEDLDNKNYTSNENDIIKRILLGHIIFYIQFDLEWVDHSVVSDLERKIRNNINLSNDNLISLHKMVDEIHSLPCNDPLYDKYINNNDVTWMENNYFSLEDFLKSIIK